MDHRPIILQFGSVLVGVVLMLSACTGESERSVRPAGDGAIPVRIAVARQPISVPFYIAQARGLFADAGLDVQMVETPTGATALKKVVSGEADFATTAETPVVHAVLDGVNVVVLATTATTRGALEVVARRDSGISTPSDLAGKRIGVSLDTNTEFFLDLFLTLHHVKRKTVEFVDADAEEFVPGMTTGDLDAVVSWEPHTTRLREELGNNALFMTEPTIYSWYWNLVTMNQFTDSHPAVSRAVLRALLNANQWLASHPGEAMDEVSSRLGLTDSATEAVWEKTRFSVTLDQALLLNMENQARRILSKRDQAEAQLPDFLNVLAADPLEGLSPGSVAIPGIGELR